MIDKFSFSSNWILMGSIGLIGTILGIITYQLVQKERLKNNSLEK